MLVFTVVEGPRVRVRKVKILGNKSFTDSKVKDEVKTKSWFPFFVSGTFDPDQVEQDVAAIRQFYENHGFFDVRVGRKVVVGPDQREVMVDFVIEEGQRYVVESISFRGNDSRTAEELRKDLNLTEGPVLRQRHAAAGQATDRQVLQPAGLHLRAPGPQSRPGLPAHPGTSGCSRRKPARSPSSTTSPKASRS